MDMERGARPFSLLAKATVQAVDVVLGCNVVVLVQCEELLSCGFFTRGDGPEGYHLSV